MAAPNLDTEVVSKNDLVSQESIQFIRAQTLTLTLVETRPNTKMYVWFGDTDVTHLCNLEGNVLGTDLVTDTIGQAVIEFKLPSGTFNVGNTEIIISDTDNLDLLNSTGSVYGSASTTFQANGILEIFQRTETTIKKIARAKTVQRDPLAQSFFTFGVEGGMFLSSIDVFFQTKDATLPVTCEIRPMVNGYPAPLEAGNIKLVSILAPSSVFTSSDASLPTKFSFNPPIYLEENAESCFVLRTNSMDYNVFTSKLGESSLEDGAKIYDNPYVGSLFKSENNITWTAEQFEDIKFNINKAVFDTGSSGILEYAVEVPALAAFGNQFSTVSGSNVVTFRHDQEHGLEVGSKFKLLTRNDSLWPDALYVNASFNGIPHTEMSTIHNITEIIDRNTLKFQVTTPATSTGIMDSCNIVNVITVLSEGINYSVADTITFSGGGGVDAAATLNVIDGKVKSVTITNSGTGYTSRPTITINTLTGTGLSIVASVTPAFRIYVNKPMTGFIPKVNMHNVGSTTTTGVISTTLGNYDGGNLVTYNSGKTFDFNEGNLDINLKQNSVIASTFNETSLMSGNISTKLTVELKSDNPNISPIIDTNSAQYLKAFSNKINNQTGETLTSLNSSGTVDSIVISAAGSAYTIDPIITISAPDLEDGVQATATSVLTGGAITGSVISAAGSGYTSTPTIVITRAVGDTTGINGAAQAVLTPFNSELLPTGGTAKSRYITKKNSLQIISSGLRLYSVISSTTSSSVDWYVRTSLSAAGVDHSLEGWQRLSCDTPRDKSSYVGEGLEYLFYLDGIPQFDNYDLKCVLTTSNPAIAPIVDSYRVIVVS